MKAVKRQLTTAYSGNDGGRTYRREKLRTGHISPVEMRIGQPDFLDMESTAKPAGYQEFREAADVIIKTPTKFFLVSGSSEGFTLLNAFDGALLASGVGDTNLVKMSSILPPGCQEMDPASCSHASRGPCADSLRISLQRCSRRSHICRCGHRHTEG